jgi:hypothetical protein
MEPHLQFEALIRDMHSTLRVMDERTQTILKQAEKTNGRVNKLEDEVDAVKNVQSTLAAKVGIGVTIAATIMATVINKIFHGL